MKFDAQKAYPYPVLRPFSDDFGGAELQTTVDLTVVKEKGILRADIEFSVSCDEIINEIEAKKAVYFVTFACRNTYFRKSFTSDCKTFTTELELNKLRDEVAIEPYILALQDIDLMSADINPEFGNGPFQYRAGNIIAQDEHQIFYLDRDLFKPITSVFDLVKSENQSGAEWALEFEQDHIKIVVSPEMKEIIDNARNSRPNRAILINSIYFSAAMQAIQHLKENDVYDEYKWAEVIRQQAHNRGIELEGCQSYEVAEKLMKFPLSLLSTYVFKGGLM